MKALLKNNTWVDIDTKCLFNDQYNTADGRRIFDKDIIKIVDDVRDGFGKCRYCGKIVKRGEEERHFQEEESKQCSACFWYRDVYQGTETIKEEKSVKVDSENNKTIEKTVIKKSIYKKQCTYENGKDCTKYQHRKMGIEWFTKENTFFLAHPNGLPEKSIEDLKEKGFIVKDTLLNAQFNKSLGSYTLTAILSYEDGKPKGCKYFNIWNCRRHYHFRFDENGNLYTDKYAFGWRKVKTLDGVPENVMKKLREICK